MENEEITPASQIMYEIRSWGFEIREIPVDKVTNSFVYPTKANGRREARANFFETKEKAKQALIDQEQMKIDGLLRQLETANEKLALAKSIITK